MNTRGLERPPLRRPYQDTKNQPPLNPGESLTYDEIYSIFKSLTSTPQTIHDDTRQEDTEEIPPTEEQDPHVNNVNCFSELPMAEEEDDTEVVFDLQHYYNTRSKGMTSQDNPPLTSTLNTGKATLPEEKVIPEIEYNLVDDLKRAKTNISLFELLKIPSIRDNLPKGMIVNKTREAQNNNLEVCTNHDAQNSGIKRVQPFLLTFEIFNRNVHNCMIDSGASSNVMPVSICRKFNATWESYPTQIV